VALRDRRLAQLGLLALFALLATVHTWPMPSDPAHLTRLDNDDTAFNTWVIAWVAHQIRNDPLSLFQAPIFYPARDALAFSEHMVVQGLASAPLHWAGLSPVLVYNLMVWAGLALSGFAMALLMRAWTASTFAGIVSGCLYAFNAHLLTRYPHLQALHLQFLPIVLYAFDRLLGESHDRTSSTRMAWLLGGAFVVQALCSNYTMVLMTLALIVGFAVRPEPWRAHRRLWIALVLTGIGVALALLPFLLPYARVRAEQGLVRTIDDVRIYSAGWTDYLATTGRLHYTWWSHRFVEGRTALFPGVLGLLLALVAVVRGVAWTDRRARMALAFGVTGVALSFGAALPGYDWLQAHIALLHGIRAVARWGLLFLIAIAILGGYGAAILEQHLRKHAWWPALAMAIVGVVTIEALRAPLAMERYEGIPAVHSRIARDDVRAVVVFPLYGGRNFNLNAEYLLHQTRHWKPMLNAYSSFAPESFHALARHLQSFPDPAAMQDLRTHGFTHVVLHRAPLDHDFGAKAVDGLRTHPDLEFVFEEDGVILYRVR
jgi:hypothetical protein